MKNKTKRIQRAAQNKGGSNRYDFISQMSDDVLLMILCLLPTKDAIATSILSTRWRFVWCNIDKLKFDDIQSLGETEKAKYINMLNSVIKNHKNPTIQYFGIHFSWNNDHKQVIDEWLQFAVNKNVEILKMHLRFSGYDSSSRLMLDKEAGANRWQSPSSLRKLSLSCVKLSNEMLQEFLTSSPHLETLSIYPVQNDLNNFRVRGRALNLKHLKLKSMMGFESVDLYDFDLVSFTSEGSVRELRLTDLPMLKELNIKKNRLSHNNLFSQMSSCLPNLQVLSICAGLALTTYYVPCLPNVKSLRLRISAESDDSLRALTNLARACPILETFTIEQQWYSQLTGRKVRHAASHPHTHLKIFQFMGYYGRNRDLELVLYVINNAVGLKRILIDPRDQNPKNYTHIGRDASKIEEAGRSSAKRKLKSISPPGVELVIL